MTNTLRMSLDNAISKWRPILSRPSEAAFDAEKTNANLVAMIVYLAVAGAIFGLLAAIERRDLFGVFGIVGYAISGVIGFFVTQAILYLVAQFFGGTGKFLTQAYLQSLFWVPLIVVVGIVRLIPVAGPWLALLIAIYMLYLTFLALKVAHRFDTTKAIMTLGVLLVISIPLSVLFGRAVGLLPMFGF